MSPVCGQEIEAYGIQGTCARPHNKYRRGDTLTSKQTALQLGRVVPRLLPWSPGAAPNTEILLNTDDTETIKCVPLSESHEELQSRVLSMRRKERNAWIIACGSQREGDSVYPSS